MALRRFGLVFNVEKCVFGVEEIDFLGHHVTARGIRPLPSKVEAAPSFGQISAAISWTSQLLPPFPSAGGSNDAAPH